MMGASDQSKGRGHWILRALRLLLIATSVLLVGVYLLHNLAGRMLTSEAAARIFDKAGIYEVFGLPASRQLSSHVAVEDDPSSGWKRLRNFVTTYVGVEDRVVTVYVAPELAEGQNWYSYNVERCGTEKCPFDATKVVPVPPITREMYYPDVQTVTELRSVFGFEFRIEYQLLTVSHGNPISVGVSIYDSAVTPLDRQLRIIGQAVPPKYWMSYWSINKQL